MDNSLFLVVVMKGMKLLAVGLCVFAILVVLSVFLPKTKGNCGTSANRPCYKSTAPAGVTCTGLRNLKFISKYYLVNLTILYLGYNQLCPPYPDYISQDDIDSQDTSDCP